MASSRVLAVDCGAGHVACGVFSAAKGGRLTLEHFALESFNPNAELEPQWNTFLTDALAPHLQREKLGGAATVTLPGHLVLTKFVKTAAVEKAKRAKAILAEAEQNIPYSLDEVVWDHQVIAESDLDLELVFTAAKLDVANGLCAAMTGIGAAPTSLSTSVFALHRAFRYNYPEACESALIISIGARSTHLLFLDKKKFFARSIVLAGNTITQAVAEEIKQDFTQAEALKLQVLGGQSELGDASPARQAVDNAAKSFVSKLQIEITRSTVNYRRQSGAEQPARIFVTGGGSLIPNLIPILAEKLKIPVERFDPLRNVDLAAGASAARERSAVLADLVGLATRLVDTQPALDLLPPEIRERLGFRRQQPFYVAAAAIVVLALALPVWGYHQAAEAAVDGNSRLDNELSPLKERKGTIDATVAKIKDAQSQVEKIHGLIASRYNWVTFFADLQERLVKVQDVWLDNLEVVHELPSEDANNANPSADAATPDASAAPDSAASGAAASGADTKDAVRHAIYKLNIKGRLIDRENVTTKVSQEAKDRTYELIKSLLDSPYIVKADDHIPLFDCDEPGIVKFEFTLVVNPQKAL